MIAPDKRPSRKETEATSDGPALCAIMVDRLRTAFGAIDSGFLYRTEALDALAFTLTGLPSGKHRDAAFAKALAALEEVARPETKVMLAAIRGAA